MSTLTLKRFSAFAWGHDNTAPEVWVNPAQVAYVQPRIITRAHAECTDGTIIYFQQEAGVLAVRESIGYVVAVLQSGQGGVCKDCFQLLDESWRALCDDCRGHRHNGVDADYEQVPA